MNHYGKSGLGFDPSFLDLVKKDFLERSDLKDTDSWMGEIYDEFYIRKDLVFDDVVKLIGFVDKGSTENRIDELEKSLSSEVSSTVAEECMFVVMGVSLFVNLEKLMPVAFFSYHHHQVLCTVKHFFWKCIRNKNRGIHGAILYNEAEVFSLPITNPNGRPMLPFDWLIHSGLILACCHKILVSDGCNFLFYFRSKQCLLN